jgi:hypothetical protein
MKTVREELADALSRCKRNLFDSPCNSQGIDGSTCLIRGDYPDMSCTYCSSNVALSRHVAEPDDRPRLLAVLKACRGLEYPPMGDHYGVFSCAVEACADIDIDTEEA